MAADLTAPQSWCDCRSSIILGIWSLTATWVHEPYPTLGTKLWRLSAISTIALRGCFYQWISEHAPTTLFWVYSLNPSTACWGCLNRHCGCFYSDSLLVKIWKMHVALKYPWLDPLITLEGILHVPYTHHHLCRRWQNCDWFPIHYGLTFSATFPRSPSNLPCATVRIATRVNAGSGRGLMYREKRCKTTWTRNWETHLI